MTQGRRCSSALVPTLALLLSTLAAPGALAQVGQVCSGVVPLGVMPPVGQEFVPGCAQTYVLMFAPPTGLNGGLAPIAFPPCAGESCADSSGAVAFMCRMLNGYPCCVDTGSCVPVLPGNMSGPLLSASQARFNTDTEQREAICHAEYTGNGSRIMIAPVVGPAGGRACYPVHGFVALFMTRRPRSGAQSYLTVEVLDPGVTPAIPETWGGVKARYAR